MSPPGIQDLLPLNLWALLTSLQNINTLMRAIKEARKLIEKSPKSQAALTLSQLVLALESESDYRLTDIYQLDYDHFKLVLEMLKEWRLDRHFAGKSRLFAASLQLADLQQQQQPEPEPKAKAKSKKAAEEATGKK